MSALRIALPTCGRNSCIQERRALVFKRCCDRDASCEARISVVNVQVRAWLCFLFFRWIDDVTDHKK